MGYAQILFRFSHYLTRSERHEGNPMLLNIIVAVFVTCLPGHILAQDSVTWSDCTPTEDFPACLAPVQELSAQRVRREIRSLTDTEWARVVDAMWIMRSLDADAGSTLYGDSFRSYDYFVVKHAVATTDARGDLGHIGAHFINWHAAYVLEFENALLAIDPRIGAMPYWDETITEPSVFSEVYFGLDPDADDNTKEITTGPFANWPINVDFSIDEFSHYFVNSTTITYVGGGPDLNILRGPANNETSSVVTRHGSGSAWEATVNDTDAWWACTDETLWNDWYRCMEQGSPRYHSGPHVIVGGRGVNGRNGDFEDRVSSPNAPIFMFHHANLDRNKMWWMRKQQQTQEGICSYFGFPTAVAPIIAPRIDRVGFLEFEGVLLNDVVASSWGFTPADLGIHIPQRPQVTNADLVCYLSPTTALYTYDTNAACLHDDDACNPVQGIIGGGKETPTNAPVAAPVTAPSSCATLETCFVLHIASGALTALSTDSVTEYVVEDGERYTVVCHVSDDDALNRMTFSYHGSVQHTEYQAEWYMRGDHNGYINDVDYLVEDCDSAKSFTVTGSVWRGECFSQDFDLQPVCA